MECSTQGSCKEQKMLEKWTEWAETRDLTKAFWIVLLMMFLTDGTIGRIITAAGMLLLILLLSWGWQVRKKTRELLKDLAHENVHYLYQQLEGMPRGERTLEKVEKAATGESITADGLSCYERGRHVPGCPHRKQ